MVFENYIANDYIRSIVIALAIIIATRITIGIIFGVIRSLTKKTKTDLDDIIMNKSATPLTIVIFLFSIKIPLAELPLSEAVQTIVSKIIFSASILVAIYLIYVLFDIIIINAWKQFEKRTKTKVDESLSSLVHTILKIVLIVLAFLYMLDLWGVEIGPLLAGLGIAGLAVALALQPTLSNIFSGISMILDKTLKVGDLVYLDSDTKGKIMKIGLRSTKIRTFDNELVIIPNSKLADGKIQNVALPEPKSRAVVPFGVAYGSDIDKVKKLIIAEIKKIEHVEIDPEPTVKFLEMANSSLNFKTYFYVDSFENRFNAIDEANTKIYNALNKAGIEIPFPQMDVHLKKD
jgi:MscS family membrane protein